MTEQLPNDYDGAWKAAQQTRADPTRRLREKLALTRRLYDLGYTP